MKKFHQKKLKKNIRKIEQIMDKFKIYIYSI